MKAVFLLIYLLTFTTPGRAFKSIDYNEQDSSFVKKLNKEAYDNRAINAAQTVNEANKALIIAQKLNYIKGIAESNRILGIGNYYLNKREASINYYLNALASFTKINDLKGEAKVYNNIGNLYIDNDYDQSMDNFQKALSIANGLNDSQLLAQVYFSIGNVYNRKENFYQALSYYDRCNALFEKFKDSVNLILCLQNRGVVYFKLKKLDKATELLLSANDKAKRKDLNEAVASIDLTLASVFIIENKFDEAQQTVSEGLNYSRIIKDQKLEHDFNYTNYELEFKRKNYEKALYYLKDIYRQDSLTFKTNLASQLGLLDVKHKQEAKDKENQLIIQRQQYDRIRFWAATTVAGLLLVSVGLLVSNVKRKAITNTQLTNLNAEVSRQKDNLDRVNHRLEEIIDERTKDLQIKNKKLYDYSSYLSHQIRGPIATLKGLINLEKEGLIDEPECIRLMNKCVGEIDNKIIETTEMLHEPLKTEL